MLRDTRPIWRRRVVRLLALLAALALAMVACSSGDDDAGDAGFETEQASGSDDGASFEDADGEAGDALEAADVGGEEDLAEGEAAEPGGDTADDDTSVSDTLGTSGATITPNAADFGRQLIFTANVHIEVDDVAAASAEATSTIENLGGFVFAQNTVGGTEPSSELVFKVLPTDFDRALDALGSVGELRNQTVTTDDVTERVVDLESRIQVAELGVDRLRTALEGAATLEDYAEIERLLLDRESELEVMRGQLRTLQDRIDLATITVLLTQDRVENAISVEVSAYEGHDGGSACPGNGTSRVEAGSPVTLCFDIVNNGDQTLTQVRLTDTVLEIDDRAQLIEVFGSLDALAPGQSVLVAHELEPERSLRLRTRVVAIPTDGVTDEQAGPSVDSQIDHQLLTFEPDSDPGFGNGFSSAVAILKAVWVAITVVIGFLIPLLIILVPLGLLLWYARRYRRPATPQPPPSTGSGSNPLDPRPGPSGAEVSRAPTGPVEEPVSPPAEEPARPT